MVGEYWGSYGISFLNIGDIGLFLKNSGNDLLKMGKFWFLNGNKIN